MRTILLPLAYVAYVGHGQRLQYSTDQLQSRSLAEDQNSLPAASTTRNFGSDPLEAFATLIRSLNVANAYNPSVLGTHSHAGNLVPTLTKVVPHRRTAANRAVHDRSGRRPRSLSFHARHQRPRMAEAIPTTQLKMSQEIRKGLSAALAEGKFRLEVAMPDGCALYGGGLKDIGNPNLKAPAEETAKGDRDLAYFISETFANLGDAVACVVPRSILGEMKNEHAKEGLLTRVVASPKDLLSANYGFGSNAIQNPLRVIILQRPNKAMLNELQPVIDDLDEVIVVLANPVRLKSGKSRPGYETAFILRANPHPAWKGGMLYRRYPDQWLLGAAATGGRVVIHGRADERPSLKEIDEGFAAVKGELDEKDRKGIAQQMSGLFSGTGKGAALERRPESEYVVGEAPEF